MKKQYLSLLAFVFAASGCATPHVVETANSSDYDLSCISLQAEMDEAKRFEQQARDEKGFTGTNVVAGLLFWPAIIGTYANANEAIEAAQNRQQHLLKIFKEKGC